METIEHIILEERECFRAQWKGKKEEEEGRDKWKKEEGKNLVDDVK